MLPAWWVSSTTRERIRIGVGAAAIAAVAASIDAASTRVSPGFCERARWDLDAASRRLYASLRDGREDKCAAYAEYLGILKTFDGERAVCLPSGRGDSPRAQHAAEEGFFRSLSSKDCPSN